MEEKIISLKNVMAYQGMNLVVNNVSFDVYKKEFVYLIGKTGSGKTSILRLLYGDLRIASGDAVVAGFEINKLNWKNVPQLRRKLGIVFQDFQLLTDRTVTSNLLFVLQATGWKDKGSMNDRISEVLDLVGLKNKAGKMPHELSGGEQQRVVIARALLNHPELILADEPTGNLDPETSDEILKLLFDISQTKGTAVVMASHDFLTIQRYPARTLRCENGKVYDSQRETVGK
jgi:cell division transport system ATP-binding protein